MVLSAGAKDHAQLPKRHSETLQGLAITWVTADGAQRTWRVAGASLQRCGVRMCLIAASHSSSAVANAHFHLRIMSYIPTYVAKELLDARAGSSSIPAEREHHLGVSSLSSIRRNCIVASGGRGVFCPISPVAAARCARQPTLFARSSSIVEGGWGRRAARARRQLLGERPDVCASWVSRRSAPASVSSPSPSLAYFMFRQVSGLKGRNTAPPRWETSPSGKSHLGNSARSRMSMLGSSATLAESTNRGLGASRLLGSAQLRYPWGGICALWEHARASKRELGSR